MISAKLAGAAAWCFHTNIQGDRPDALFQALIESEPEPERAFVNALLPRINLRTSNGINFVAAEGGGGGDVNADRLGAGPFETFTVEVLSGDRSSTAIAWRSARSTTRTTCRRSAAAGCAACDRRPDRPVRNVRRREVGRRGGAGR